jgi:hypothetical protein
VTRLGATRRMHPQPRHRSAAERRGLPVRGASIASRREGRGRSASTLDLDRTSRRQRRRKIRRSSSTRRPRDRAPMPSSSEGRPERGLAKSSSSCSAAQLLLPPRGVGYSATEVAGSAAAAAPAPAPAPDLAVSFRGVDCFVLLYKLLLHAASRPERKAGGLVLRPWSRSFTNAEVVPYNSKSRCASHTLK